MFTLRPASTDLAKRLEIEMVRLATLEEKASDFVLQNGFLGGPAQAHVAARQLGHPVEGVNGQLSGTDLEMTGSRWAFGPDSCVFSRRSFQPNFIRRGYDRQNRRNPAVRVRSTPENAMLTPVSFVGGPKAIAANILKAHQDLQRELNPQDNGPQDEWHPDANGRDQGIAVSEGSHRMERSFFTYDPRRDLSPNVSGQADWIKHETYFSDDKTNGHHIKEWFHKDSNAPDELVYMRAENEGGFRFAHTVINLKEDGTMTRKFGNAEDSKGVNWATGVTFKMDEQFLAP